jgi:predicted TIM-barrel fold metal-dependent hydrolase
LSAHLSAAQIKARLDHPIIDADGHWIEYGTVFTEELRRVGGEDAVEGWNAVRNGTRSALSMSVEERRRRRISQEAFWGHPSKNTKDLATALFPRLLAERLDEIGLDFAIIYPTGGLRVPRVGADKPRRAAARAYNIVTAEYFRPFADRMTPAAIIPMHTPEEAIEELDFAVKQLGYKVAMLGSLMDRPVAAAGDVEGEAKRFAVWKDVIGLDSEYDYDPVWAKCLELDIAPSFHSGARRSGLRLSPSNFVYNHIGLCRRQPRRLQGNVSRRRDAPLPGPQHGVPRRRRRLGLPLVRRPARPLGKAQPQRPGRGRPAQYRQRRSAGSRREIRWRSVHCGAEAAGRPILPGRGEIDRRYRQSRRLQRLRDQPKAGLARPLRDAVLFRLRGRRPVERLGLQCTRQSIRRQVECDLQL